MSPADAARVIAESERLRSEIDQHEQQDRDVARRAEASRPDARVSVPGLPQELAELERHAILGVLPRRSLWPELDGHDQRVAEVQARQAEAQARGL